MGLDARWQPYRKKQLQWLRPYEEGERLPERVSVSAADREAGSPKAGDMIAHGATDAEDQWLVSKEFFEANYEPALKEG
jgi:hypothetical protein